MLPYAAIRFRRVDARYAVTPLMLIIADTLCQMLLMRDAADAAATRCCCHALPR